MSSGMSSKKAMRKNPPWKAGDFWDDWRRPPPYNIGNCCTHRDTVRECPFNHFRWLVRWVPRLWTEDQKANRLAVCERLDTTSSRRRRFLKPHCHLWWDAGASIHPEVKQASTEWRKPGEVTSWKPRFVFLLGKFLQRFFGIAETHCSSIFSMNGVQLMLRTTANCLMKWNCPIDEKSETCLFEVWLCSTTTLH